MIEGYGLSEDAYSFGYHLRLKYASFKQGTMEWLSNHCTELLPTGALKILSLGCGNGSFDIEFIKIIQQHKKDFHFTGLDFSATDLKSFHENLATLDQATQSKISLMYQKFDHSTDLGERFDLMIMVHFLHSFEKVLPVIQNSIKHLSVDGKLVIIQQNEQGIYKIKDRFIDVLPNQKFQSSDHIKALLKKEGIAFTSYKIDTYFDVSILRKMSLDALSLMSFCFNNDLSILNSQQQNTIREAFLNHAQKQDDGRHIINESMEAIVCHA